MSSLCHYSLFDQGKHPNINSCNIESAEYPISVNCAGEFTTSYPFTTDNPTGRRDIYFIYVTRGTMTVYTDTIQRQVSAGDIVIFPPNKPYKYTYTKGESLNYLWIHFTGSYAERILKDCCLYPLPFFGIASEDCHLPDKFRRLFDKFDRRDPLARQKVAVCAEEIILEAAEACSSEKKKNRPLERSIRYIHSAYSQKLSIPQLAAMENLSNSRYIALFNKHMGMSPSAYILELRLNYACELLKSTDMSIKQVGHLVGYTDSHFFSKIFKKYTGISPTEYKNTLK